MDPPVNQAEMPAISLHHISFTVGFIAHIDTKGRWTPQNQAEMPAIPLHHISFTVGSIAHIDTKGRWTPPKLSRDACHTTRPYKFYCWIYCTYRYQRQMDPTNQAEMPAIPLYHISFTVGSIAHIDTKGRWTPPGRDIWWQLKIQWLAVEPLHTQDLRFEQNGNLQVFLSGIGDTFVSLKANAKKIITLKCI